jgi:hypothetical protein
MHWQQITMIVLWAISGTITLVNHGKPPPNYDFGVWLIELVIAFILFYSAGFFSN